MLVTAYEDNTLGSSIGSTTAVTVPYKQFSDQTFEVTITGGGTHTLDLVFTGSNDYWVVNDVIVRAIANVQPITFTEMGQTTTATGTTIDEYKGTVGAAGLLKAAIHGQHHSRHDHSHQLQLHPHRRCVAALLRAADCRRRADTFYFEVQETGGLGTAELTANEVNGLAVTSSPTADVFTAASFRNLAFRAGSSPALSSGNAGRQFLHDLHPHRTGPNGHGVHHDAGLRLERHLRVLQRRSRRLPSPTPWRRASSSIRRRATSRSSWPPARTRSTRTWAIPRWLTPT